jgi:beta-lactamase regulating signal transducer with metallopeptidase domain
MNEAIDWLVQAGCRVTLLLSGAAVLGRWMPGTHPELRRWSAAGLALLAMVAPGIGGWWWIGGLGDSNLSARRPGVVWPGVAGSLCVLWVLGSGWCLLSTIAQGLRLQRLIRRSRRLATPVPLAAVTPVLESDEVSGPCVAGLWRPVMLVPVASRSWDVDQWRMVVGHESQHIRQGDLLIAWIPRLLLVCYWWHPLAHWLVRRFRLESEILCDRAAIIHAGVSPRTYAAFLLDLDACRLPRPAAAMAGRARLSQRIERLLQPASGRRLRPWQAFLIVGALALTTFAAVSLRVHKRSDEPRDATIGPIVPASETTLRLTASPFPADN